MDFLPEFGIRSFKKLTIGSTVQGKNLCIKPAGCQRVCRCDVRLIGLEPTQLALPDPKSGVSTNFTTGAAKRVQR